MHFEPKVSLRSNIWKTWLQHFIQTEYIIPQLLSLRKSVCSRCAWHSVHRINILQQCKKKCPLFAIVRRPLPERRPACTASSEHGCCWGEKEVAEVRGNDIDWDRQPSGLCIQLLHLLASMFHGQELWEMWGKESTSFPSPGVHHLEQLGRRYRLSKVP